MTPEKATKELDELLERAGNINLLSPQKKYELIQEIKKLNDIRAQASQHGNKWFEQE